jgi:hypothetical protein
MPRQGDLGRRIEAHVLGQRRDHPGRHRYVADLPVLRLGEAHPAAYPLDLHGDMHAAAEEVEIIDGQGEKLTLPHPHRYIATLQVRAARRVALVAASGVLAGQRL